MTHADDPLEALQRLRNEIASDPTRQSNYVVDLDAAIAAWEKERAELLAEVREWMCGHCRTVYPGPPQQGVRCVICPQCKGPTAPRSNIVLYAALLAEVLKIAEEMDGVCFEPVAQEDNIVARTISAWKRTGKRWAARLRKACE